MLLVKIFEIILIILAVGFSAMFAVACVAMIITKGAINEMMEFKGDKKNEQ